MIKDNLYLIIPILLVLVGFAFGYIVRMFEDWNKTAYSLTEAELNNVYRNLWNKAKTLGTSQSPIIHSKEWEDSMFNSHLHECIKEERSDK